MFVSVPAPKVSYEFLQVVLHESGGCHHGLDQQSLALQGILGFLLVHCPSSVQEAFWSILFMLDRI